MVMSDAPEVDVMTIRVNGESFDCPEGCTLSQLIEQLNLADRRVAIEVNQSIVPGQTFSSFVLTPGDVLEIVSFVGGG